MTEFGLRDTRLSRFHHLSGRPITCAFAVSHASSDLRLDSAPLVYTWPAKVLMIPAALPSTLTPEIRHTCEQSDALSSYTYTQHDGRRYAAQTLVDGKNNVRMNVTFLKANGEDSNGGWEWAVRIEGDSIDPGENEARTRRLC